MYEYPYEYYNRKRAKRKAFYLKSAVLLAVSAVLVFSALGVYLFRAEKTAFGETLYILAADVPEDEAQTAAEEIAEKGGAGVLYSVQGRGYPVYACYYSASDAETVGRRLQNAGEKTAVFGRGADKLYFRGPAARSAKEEVSAAASALFACSQSLYAAANGLEEGRVTPSAALAAAENAADTVVRAFERAGGTKISEKKKYRAVFAGAEAFAQAAEEVCKSTVTAGAVRRLHAQACLFFLSVFDCFCK